MNFFDTAKYLDNKEVIFIILLILGLLVTATLLFFIWGKVKPQANLTELKMRTKSWWAMAAIFVLATTIHPIVSYVAFGLLSFAAMREIASISKNVRAEDRRVIIWCYLAIPIQYFIAYKGWFNLFIIFIPVIMYIWIPFVLVIRGITTEIGRSMSVLPTQLMLTVFSISHLAYLLSLPEIEGFHAGGRGLLLFVVFLTEMNDVFQFTWGKLFGKHKIIPKISPNKTWEGFVGGILTTTVLAYFIKFLTPLNGIESLVVGFMIAFAGFVGDVVVSAVKRDIGLKDTGTLIPGHGGLLDRIDSLSISAPVFFYIVYNLYYA
ncbi:MAG: phosphatidate cytidylyltransferase [Bacteroidetes bacterium]|nr:phosphatidate cytidylyltransferase [Bacteroidota bacterium]